MQLTCESMYSCFASGIKLNKIGIVNISAFDQFALTQSKIDVSTSNSLQIYCASSSVDEYACNDLTVHIPSTLTDNSNIYNNRLICEEYGCGNLSIFAINGMQDLIVDIDSNCNCHSVYDCISQWNLFCGSTDGKFTNKSTFNGKYVTEFVVMIS